MHHAVQFAIAAGSCSGVHDLWTFPRLVALQGHGSRPAAYVAGRSDVNTWLPIAIVAGTQVAVRLICAIASIRQERARARSNCDQIETTARSGAIFCETRAGGPTVMIIPSVSGAE